MSFAGINDDVLDEKVLESVWIWNDINDESIQIPWTKVLLYDGANTFFGWLERIEITNTGRKVYWKYDGNNVKRELEALKWTLIKTPKH